jgi:hypothetical protein
MKPTRPAGTTRPDATREQRRRHGGQGGGVVQLAIGEQAAVGGDPRAMEFEFQAAGGWTLTLPPEVPPA